MSTLVTRDLDWITSAPVSIRGEAHSAAAPDVVFAQLADHERWPEWFPNVKRVEVLGPASGVGARRRVKIPGATVDEIFIAWEEGVRWSFTGTAAKPGIFRSLVEDCRLSPGASGGTDISYTMYLEPAGVGKLMFRFAKGTVSKGLTTAMQNLAKRAASA